MVTWTAKDPDAIQDYLYTIPLDEGDSVTSYTFVKTSGSVVINSHSRSGADVTAWLSGGTDGETNAFRIAWVTAAGRTVDDLITLAIVANSYVPLVLTGYAKPLPVHLITRYPSFAAVEPSTIAFWLADAERYVDDSWLEGDYAAALMAMAAHNMALSGQGTEAAATADLPAGITGMRIGTLGLTFDGAITRDKATGSLSSTRYGAEYATLLKRNKAGPRVAAAGVVDWYGGLYPMGAW